MKRNIKTLSEPLRKFIDTLAFDEKVYVMGSFSDKRLKYPSDVDLFQPVKTKYKNKQEASQEYENILKDVVLHLVEETDCYISGIILGLENDKPKKWKVEEFLDADLTPYIQQPSMIKIDAIKRIDGLFTDFSIVYQFFNNNTLINNYELFRNVDLKSDVEKFRKEKNYYKMLKRQYALKESDDLREIFNSDLGKLSQVMAQLETIIFMLENYKRISFVKFRHEIDMIINKLNSIHELKDFLQHETKYINILKRMEEIQNRKIYYKDLIKKLTKIVKDFDSILQTNTKKAMKKYGL